MQYVIDVPETDASLAWQLVMQSFINSGRYSASEINSIEIRVYQEWDEAKKRIFILIHKLLQSMDYLSLGALLGHFGRSILHSVEERRSAVSDLVEDGMVEIVKVHKDGKELEVILVCHNSDKVKQLLRTLIKKGHDTTL